MRFVMNLLIQQYPQQSFAGTQTILVQAALTARKSSSLDKEKR